MIHARSTLAVLALGGLGIAPVRAADAEPDTTVPAGELAAYAAIGFAVGEKIHLGRLRWSEAQFRAFVSGLRRHFVGGAPIAIDGPAQSVYAAINDAIHRAQGPTAPGDLPEALRVLVRQLALEPTDRGVYVRILRGGSGARPTPADTVVVSFSARSVDTGEDVPALSAQQVRIKVAELMPGLAYGAQLLALEGHALLLVPEASAFGESPWPEGVPRSPLMFLLQLHDVIAAGTERAP